MIRVKLWDVSIPQNVPKPLKTILFYNWHVGKITQLLTEVFFVGRDERWLYFLCVCVWPCHAAFRILAAQPGTDPRPSDSGSLVLTARSPGKPQDDFGFSCVLCNFLSWWLPHNWTTCVWPVQLHLSRYFSTAGWKVNHTDESEDVGELQIGRAN